ncbi:MAG: hypothetical protein QOF08_524, partial [Gaiellales bacterium]|nr:hypothetical protein [Gaiellales bacterium]
MSSIDLTLSLMVVKMCQPDHVAKCGYGAILHQLRQLGQQPARQSGVTEQGGADRNHRG